MLESTVGDIMSENIITIRDDATIGQAAHILLRCRISGLLLTKGNNRKNIVGVVTTTDLLRLLSRVLSMKKNKLSKLANLSKIPIATISTKNVLRIQKNMNVKRALVLMQKKDAHTIPVYDKDKLVGVIGKHDILNTAFVQ